MKPVKIRTTGFKPVARSVFAALLLALALSACTRTPSNPKTAASEECKVADLGPANSSLPAPPGEKPSDGDWLVYRLEAEPGTLNPLITNDGYAQDVDNNFMEEFLFKRDIETQEFKPQLAERWEVSEDKLEFTFYLRRGVKWHDGAPFTAQDVVYTFQRIMDLKVDAAVARSYYSECESVTALDDYTVRFRWKKPYFKALELSGEMDIVPQHVLNDGTDFNSHPFGRHPIFTGPYRLREWKTGQEIVLERNPDYWGPRPHLDRIVFKIITDNDAALQLFNQGGLDFMNRITPIQWREQTNSPSFLLRANKLYYDYPYFNYIGWNLRRPPFDDRRVRLAMTLTLDRQALLKNIYYCLGTVVSGEAYVQTPYYDQTIKPWPHDPEQAKKLLDEAGWIDHDGDGWRDKDGKPFRFEFLYSTGSQTAEKIATIFKEDLQKIGVDMVIRQLDWAVYLEQVQQWNFDACTMGWSLVPDPDPYQIWHSSGADLKNSSNHVGFKNPEVDRLIELNRREFDKQKRVQYSRQIHRILHQEQPYTFLLAPKWLSVIDKRFHNVKTYPLRPSFKFEEWYVPKELQKYSSTP